MIAEPHGCQLQPLHELIEDALPEKAREALTRHLDNCPDCRYRLDAMTADNAWWDDARSSLSDCQELSSTAGRAVDAKLCRTEEMRRSEHWVQALLEKSPDASALGTLDGLTIERVLGQGGMGVVVKAHDDELHRDLAIKLLSPMLASNGAARQRFFREAQSAAAVVHPNIVPIYAVSKDSRIPYIAMPFIGNGSLQQLLNDEGPLPVERVLAYGLQVAEGLAAAHQQGIIHRDIKPANLLLDEGGFRLLITDFGLARALDDATLTASGMIAGTPQYMSPEQAMGRSVEHRSDIYSLGAVMYAMATGHPPVTGNSTLEILRRCGEERPRPISELNETFPLWFQSVMDLLMAKSPERRPGSATEVAAMLRECLMHLRAPRKNALPAAIRGQRLAGKMLAAAAGVGAGCVLIVAMWAAREPLRELANDSMAWIAGAMVQDPGTQNTSVNGSLASGRSGRVMQAVDDRDNLGQLAQVNQGVGLDPKAAQVERDTTALPWVDTELDRAIAALEAETQSLMQVETYATRTGSDEPSTPTQRSTDARKE